jgi:chemotaxis protein MotB
LTDEAKKLLDDVAVILKRYEDHLIEIEGHTDNIPIKHEIFTSNNVLSDYRALAVFEYLVDEGINPAKLKHSGRGEYAPIATNDTAEGRAQNRRVEIKIYNSFSSK